MFGMSYKNLYFTPGNEPGTGRTMDELILESGGDCNVWNCNACGFTLLDRRGRIRKPKKRGAANWWEKYH